MKKFFQEPLPGVAPASLKGKLIVIEGHPPLYEREKWDIYKQVLALLESLPEDSK